MEPSAAHDVRRGLRLLPVALHHSVAASDDLANRLAIVRHIIAFRIPQPESHCHKTTV
jgi:hypothetical protein